MSLDESESLLKAADDADYSKASMRATFGVVMLIAFFVTIALGLWLLSLVIGTTAAGIIGFLAVMMWLWWQE